jgi:hypothetical protein
MVIEMVLVLKEMAMMAAAVIVLTLLYKKFLMAPMGLASGVLPLISVALGFFLPMALHGAMGMQSSMEVLWMSGPLASWLWDALLRYFWKK